MSDIKILNQKPFQILLIEPGSISKLDWNNPNYLQTLISMPFIKSYETEADLFFNKLEDLLQIGSDGTNFHLMTEMIADEPNYNYEIIYVDTLNKKSGMEFNELASMLHVNNEIVKGNCVIIKNYIPTLDISGNTMSFSDMTSSELYKILRRRGFTTVVTWEDDWKEEEFYGDIENYAKKFFEDEYYHKFEISFLKHNLNIWYTKSEYGKKNVCGNLIDCLIDKCFIFTKLTDTIRGYITKDEVNKILKLSTVLKLPYQVDNKWLEEEKDEFDRKIIKNKYRILDNVYQENIINF